MSFVISKAGKGYQVMVNGVLVTDKPTRGECIAIVQAIESLIDWSGVTSHEAFNALPVESRNAVGIAMHNASMDYADKQRQAKMAKLDAKLADNARYADGVPFNQAPKAKQYKIPATRLICRGMVDGREWHTDGYFAMEGTHPDASKDAPIQQFVPRGFGWELRPVGYYQAGARILAMNDGTVMDYDMFSHILKRFPDATFHGNGKLYPVGFKVDGRTVAIMMPLNPTQSVPASVRAMIDG